MSTDEKRNATDSALAGVWHLPYRGSLVGLAVGRSLPWRTMAIPLSRCSLHGMCCSLDAVSVDPSANAVSAELRRGSETDAALREHYRPHDLLLV